MTRNEYIYVAIFFLTFVVVGFSTGYWLGSLKQSNTIENSTLELEARLNALESRMSEQLLIVPNATLGLQFEIINLGNITVSISQIRINDVINDTSPGWLLQNDNMLLAGEMSNVIVNPEKYLVRITETLIFSFRTTRGNVYYCVLDANRQIEDGLTFEQIELPTVYGKAITSPWAGWDITIELKNTGSADATLNNIFINSIPFKDYNQNNVFLTADGVDVHTTLYINGVLVLKGNTVTLHLQLKQDGSVGFTAGTRIEIKLHTAAGKDYPTSLKLP